MSNQQPGQKTVFRRIGGRVVPIRVRNEARTTKKVAKEVAQPSSLKHLARAAGFVAGSMALSFGAGKLQKLSELARFAKHSGKIQGAARAADYGGKFGAGIMVGSEVMALDRKTKHDEKSSLFNMGTHGRSFAGLAVSAVGGYASYRTAKRFQKWGYKGGKFPWQLKDL